MYEPPEGEYTVHTADLHADLEPRVFTDLQEAIDFAAERGGGRIIVNTHVTASERDGE